MSKSHFNNILNFYTILHVIIKLLLLLLLCNVAQKTHCTVHYILILTTISLPIILVRPYGYTTII